MNMIAEKTRKTARSTPVAAPAAAASSVLSSRAMLVTLTIKQWSPFKVDRKATQDAIDASGAASDAGRFNKALLASGALKAITAAANKARAIHYRLSQPWTHAGANILSAAIHDTYRTEIEKARAEFESGVRDFLPAFPAMRDESQVRLGGMFNPADYPSEAEIASRFSFDWKLYPVPTGADFRVNLSEAQAAAVRADIERTAAEALAGAQRDAWQRVAEAVGHMAAKLKEFKPGADGSRASGIFRDSLVDNVRELAAILPGLNIAADPALDAIAARLASLCTYEAEALRVSEPLRTEVQAQAAAIAADVAQFMA